MQKAEHHALLLVGDRERLDEHLELLLRAEDMSLSHPDVRLFSYETMGIPDARMLRDAAYSKPMSAPYQRFVIFASSITLEAQNALLKLFEDPPNTARFILGVHTISDVIPTLRSRFVVETVTSAEKGKGNHLPTSIAEMLSRAVAVSKSKNQKDIEAYARDVEHVLATSARTGAVLSPEIKLLSYLSARGASPKMILEHCLITLRESA